MDWECPFWGPLGSDWQVTTMVAGQSMCWCLECNNKMRLPPPPYMLPPQYLPHDSTLQLVMVCCDPLVLKMHQQTFDRLPLQNEGPSYCLQCPSVRFIFLFCSWIFYSITFVQLFQSKDKHDPTHIPDEVGGLAADKGPAIPPNDCACHWSSICAHNNLIYWVILCDSSWPHWMSSILSCSSCLNSISALALLWVSSSRWLLSSHFHRANIYWSALLEGALAESLARMSLSLSNSTSFTVSELLEPDEDTWLDKPPFLVEVLAWLPLSMLTDEGELMGCVYGECLANELHPSCDGVLPLDLRENGGNCWGEGCAHDGSWVPCLW